MYLRSMFSLIILSLAVYFAQFMDRLSLIILISGCIGVCLGTMLYPFLKKMREESIEQEEHKKS